MKKSFLKISKKKQIEKKYLKKFKIKKRNIHREFILCFASSVNIHACMCYKHMEISWHSVLVRNDLCLWANNELSDTLYRTTINLYICFVTNIFHISFHFIVVIQIISLWVLIFFCYKVKLCILAFFWKKLLPIFVGIVLFMLLVGTLKPFYLCSKTYATPNFYHHIYIFSVFINKYTKKCFYIQ